MKKISLFFILLLTLFFIQCNNEKIQEPDTYIVLVSLDGFRWDYASMTETPNLDYIAEHGVKAESLIPIFPTKTFPNHISLITGLYAENHGIVLNDFYAPDLGKYYSTEVRNSVQDPDFYLGEPIWTTAEKQGIKTAAYFWVGSEDQDKLPGIWKKYDHDFPYIQRIDSVINWLEKPLKDRPQFVSLYFDEPDGSGHYYGPESEEIKSIISQLDYLIGILFEKLQSLPIADKINLIIVSDHGMATVTDDKNNDLKQLCDTNLIEHMDGTNPIFNIKPKENKKAELIKELQKIKGLIVMENDSIPERLHYKNSIRTHDITVVAEPGWSLNYGKGYGEGGAHGYDNNFKDMHAIFYAIGPAFKKGYQTESFENIHIYSLIADILQIEPAKTDGNIDSIKHILEVRDSRLESRE